MRDKYKLLFYCSFLFFLATIIIMKQISINSYDNVLDLTIFFWTTLSIIIIAYITQRYLRKKIMLIVLIIVVVTNISFFVSILPKYSYEEAKLNVQETLSLQNKNVVVKKGITELTNVEKVSFFVKEPYIFEVVYNNGNKYCMFNPLNGEYTLLPK